MESPTGPVCELASSAGSNGSGCLQSELGPLPGICFPPIRINSTLPEQNKEGQGGDDFSGFGLAGSTVVPSTDGFGLRATTKFSTERRDPIGSVGLSTPIDGASIAVACRMEIIRERYQARGLSNQVVKLLVGANRDTTAAAYQSAWNGWRAWCICQNQNPVSPDLSKIL